MTSIGVRELKNSLSSVLRQVGEEGAEVVVTVHGQPVAVLRPFDAEEQSRQRLIRRREALASLDPVVEALRGKWKGSLQDVMDDIRR